MNEHKQPILNSIAGHKLADCFTCIYDIHECDTSKLVCAHLIKKGLL